MTIFAHQADSGSDSGDGGGNGGGEADAGEAGSAPPADEPTAEAPSSPTTADRRDGTGEPEPAAKHGGAEAGGKRKREDGEARKDGASTRKPGGSAGAERDAAAPMSRTIEVPAACPDMQRASSSSLPPSPPLQAIATSLLLACP